MRLVKIEILGSWISELRIPVGYFYIIIIKGTIIKELAFNLKNDKIKWNKYKIIKNTNIKIQIADCITQ